MDNIYNRNGLIFWNAKEIGVRNFLASYFVGELGRVLKNENRAFEMIQVEASLLTPQELINPAYCESDYFKTSEGFALRPETTMGSYAYAQHLLAHSELRAKLPICVWQHGKSFRREQDQATKFMRLKEFYQLEFQCIYGLTTANDYSKAVIPAAQRMISDMIGPCRVEDSDRLPEYSERTTDIICEHSELEVCSISIRKDFPNAKVLEIAIGTDRCVFSFLGK